MSIAMHEATTKPLLLIGGYGVAGRSAARLIRTRHPELPIVVAGRNLAPAEELCRELGEASALRADLHEPGLGLAHADYLAVIVYAKDTGLHAMDFAGQNGLPYLGLSSAAFELAPDLSHGLIAGRSAPVVVAGNWFAGAAILLALSLAERFGAVDSITLGIVVEPDTGGGGPASVADFKRILGSCPTRLTRTHGTYSWETGEAGSGTFRRADGVEVQGSPAVSPDVAGLGAATKAREVRVLENWGPSSSSARGGPCSDEIIIEISGRDPRGRDLALRRAVVGSRNSAPLTALTATILMERLLGLDGEAPPTPGFYTPDVLMPATSFVAAMKEVGVVLEER